MFDNHSNQEGERRPRPRFRREAEQQPRPRFHRDDEQRPHFHHDADQQQSRPRFHQDGEQRPRFNKPFKPKRNNGLYSERKQQTYRQQNEDPTKPIRLNKYLANAGICSRREADDFIQAGVITVNGQVVDNLGAKVLPTDEVRFHDQPVRRERKVYILLNKPKNTVTTTDDPQERNTVIDIVRSACAERIYPVGRLDRNTTGVLLLTNDGELAKTLTHPSHNVKKLYHVTLNKPLTESDFEKIQKGLTLEDGPIEVDKIDYVTDDPTMREVGVEIHSGRNHIVRRIFESLGYEVIKLDRVMLAGLTKQNLPRGHWRFLTSAEISMLKRIE